MINQVLELVATGSTSEAINCLLKQFYVFVIVALGFTCGRFATMLDEAIEEFEKMWIPG